jgi:predicted nucleic acid-binding protein
MKKLEIIIDTNVVVSALRSQRGASYKLLMEIGSDKFDINVSVPLILEYESVAKRLIGKTQLKKRDIDDILDYICSEACIIPPQVTAKSQIKLTDKSHLD